MSNCCGKDFLPCQFAQDAEHLARDVTLEAANDLCFGHSFASPASHVGFRPIVMAEPDDDDSIESGVRLAVATPIEPVSASLPGGSGYGAHSTEGGERSLGLEALRITPCGDEQRCGGVGTDAEDFEKGRCRVCREPAQLFP